MNYSFLVEFGLLFDNETIDGQLFDIYVLEKSRQHNWQNFTYISFAE